MPFGSSDVQEVFETEPNNIPAEAQPIKQPLLINGRIQKPGDRDVFEFQGVKGDSVSIEVIARRLNSPLDSVVTLSGPGLEKPVRNDDNMDKDKTHLHLGAGLVTHHADSYLLQELPASGTYFVEIADTQSKGGQDYSYRLRISPSNPDFQLRMEPSGLHIGPGGTAAFTIRAMRKDGFAEKITLDVANLPEGFSMRKTVIPKDSDTTRFTITAPKEIVGKNVSPEITGTGMIGGRTITRTAIPVDDQMQAFLYRHLVPAQELVLIPVSQKPPVVFKAILPEGRLVELPLGKEIRIQLNGRIIGEQKGCTLRLNNPPEGITLKSGWIGKQGKGKQGKGKKARGNQGLNNNSATGSILICAEEPLKAGTHLSLVVEAEIKRGKVKTE